MGKSCIGSLDSCLFGLNSVCTVGCVAVWKVVSP